MAPSAPSTPSRFSPLRPLFVLCLGLPVAAQVLSACGDDDGKKKLVEKVTASASASAAAAASVAPPDPNKLPVIKIDLNGVAYLGGERVELKLPDASQKLEEVLSKYNLEGKSLPVTAYREARTGDVMRVLAAIGARGVSDFTLHTTDRDHKDKALTFVPEKAAGKLADCTVAATVSKERYTSSWAIRGGTATKYAKGMAGPDMTQTLAGMTKQINGCDSTFVVVAGHESVEWALTFDLANLVATAQPPLKIQKFVLPKETPTAGQPFKPAG
jgi:biopolymer transport protein ExbD